LTAIVQFPADSGFDAEATTAMGAAFDAACGAVGGRGQPSVVQEVIARRIIAAAKKGERDPQRLCENALKALRPRPD
jgi:hypothetical protein